MNDFVKVQSLTKKYGDLIAVDDLSFTVRTGEIFGFLGPNGAGKSTTLNVLTSLVDYDKGEIEIDGYNLSKDEKSIKALIGLIPQNIALYPTLSAYENVSFFASLYGIKGRELKKAVDEALDFVGLYKQAKKRAGKLSGGMQRRLNIACGIAHKPKLIVMDEPTVGVDAQSRELIMDSIRTLRDNGATIIYTSHYMPEVQEICDRIAIIDKGHLVASGSEEELLEIVTDTKTLIVDIGRIKTGENQKLTMKLESIPGVKRVQISDENKIKIDVPLNFTGVNSIIKILSEENIEIGQLISQAPNLETTFLALTGRELK